MNRYVKIGAGTFVAVVVLVLLLDRGKQTQPPAAAADTQAQAALLRCQTAIRNASKNGAAAVVPSVQNNGGDGDTFIFEWLRGRGAGLRLQNSFGAMLDAEATCVVAKADLEINWLTIDSETVLRRASN